MQTHTLDSKNILRIFYPKILTDTSAAKATEDFICQIEDLFDLDVAAYAKRSHLAKDLRSCVFEKEEFSSITNLSDETKIQITKQVICGIQKTDSCVSSKKDIDIFIFPTKNKKISDMLGGVNAFALGTHSIYIFIDTQKNDWQEKLTKIIPHEYAHLVSFCNHTRDTILDAMVFEGLAEHLREHLYGGDRAKYSIALSKQAALKELENLPSEVTDLLITKDNYDLHLSYFFGTKQITNWYGYSVGYWLIDAVLNDSDMGLIELFLVKPSDVLKKHLLLSTI